MNRLQIVFSTNFELFYRTVKLSNNISKIKNIKISTHGKIIRGWKVDYHFRVIFYTKLHIVCMSFHVSRNSHFESFRMV